jgi:hypothetical protein
MRPDTTDADRDRRARLSRPGSDLVGWLTDTDPARRPGDAAAVAARAMQLKTEKEQRYDRRDRSSRLTRNSLASRCPAPGQRLFFAYLSAAANTMPITARPSTIQVR